MVTIRSKKQVGPMILMFMLVLMGVFSQVHAVSGYNQLDLIEFSSYFGGTDDESMGVVYAFGDTAIDSKGNIILAGASFSDDFPIKNAYQDHLNGYRDSIIAKFHPNGSLIFSTYLGGSAQELITGLAIDSEDNIIISGITGSPDYPLVNPFQANFTGGTEENADCFISKISEDGQTLLFSTYFGGTDSDWMYGLSIDSNDRIAVTGATESIDFPLLNPTQDTNGGSLDGFLSFFEADGQSLIFSTYLGTSGIDHGRQVGFNSEDELFLAGMMANGDLSTEGSYQDEYGGGSSDAFLAKFEATGDLEYFTFLGGTNLDTANDMAIDSNDNIVLTGYSISDDFPILNAAQTERSDRAEMFITKFAPDGQSIVFSTYMGGSSADHGNAIRVDSQDRIIVVGQTTSNDFPTTNPLNITESRYDNVVLVILNQDGSVLFSTLFGGSRDDVGICVTPYANDTYIVAGYSDSTDYPVYDAYQESHSGSNDMFIMKLNLAGLIDIPPGGLPFGILEGGIIVGVVIVVLVSIIFVRKKMGR